MEKLLYRRIDNPLNNKRFVKDVLYEYIFNDSLFNALFVNKKKRNNQSITFHDILFKSNYDDWKKKIDQLYESLTDDDSKAEDIRILHEFLNNYHVKNFKDLWQNNIFRILLVVVGTNIGVSIATLIILPSQVFIPLFMKIFGG